jgi:hypothetical protein
LLLFRQSHGSERLASYEPWPHTAFFALAMAVNSGDGNEVRQWHQRESAKMLRRRQKITQESAQKTRHPNIYAL